MVTGILESILGDVSTAFALVKGDKDEEIAKLEVLDDKDQPVLELEAKRKLLVLRSLDIAGQNLAGLLGVADVIRGLVKKAKEASKPEGELPPLMSPKKGAA